MSSNRAIQNYNQLEMKSIQLVLDRLPHVTYFCTSASVPGITVTAARQYNPFTDIKVTGDKVTFQPLIVNFIIDEEMKNWEEIFNWIVSYAHPTSFDEYKNDSQTRNNLYASKFSNAKLLVPNNKYNTTHEFTFDRIHPIDISDVVFDTQIDGTVVGVCTATFEYDTYRKTI